MESSAQNSFRPPAKPISEFLPTLRGLQSDEVIKTLTAKKKPRAAAMSQPGTTEKMRPMTLAEMNISMRGALTGLKPNSKQQLTQAATSTKKKNWNCSVKVENKTKTHTSNGQMINNPVRKVLNFQPKLKTVTNSGANTSETRKFPKPNVTAKRPPHLQVENNNRISGVYNILQTPVETNKPVRKTFYSGNTDNNRNQASFNRKLIPPPTKYNPGDKENSLHQAYSKRKLLPPPTPLNQKVNPSKFLLDTPHSNSFWKSGSDESFLQKEKEIHEVEAKIQAYAEENTLEKIEDVSPPVSTPFKEYRSVQDYFNNSSTMENSAVYNDNTIMCFDKPSVISDSDKREDSVIVSLCELFTKATVTNGVAHQSITLKKLLELKKETEESMKMTKNFYDKINETQMKSLQNIIKLIDEKIYGQGASCENNETLVADPSAPIDIKITSPDKSPIISRPCSVIKLLKSPSYTIPKKNSCLRKKLFCKSMPNVSTCMQTPVKEMKGEALNMYMKMKEQMNFLSTPMVNREKLVPDTPAVTSHNLHKQLDKLYSNS